MTRFFTEFGLGQEIGNVRQAFTHLSLIDASLTLDAALDGRPPR